MRTSLSPLMQQIKTHILSVAPDTEFTDNLVADNFTAHLGRGRIFQISPITTRSYDTVAEWPLYVVAIPPPEPGPWECHTMEEILETLRFPTVFPNVRRISVAEMRERAGF